MTIPSDVKTGRRLSQEGEFDMMYKKFRSEEIDEECQPFLAPGYKPLVMIPDKAEMRLDGTRDCWRAWGEENRQEASNVATTNHTGDPNYAGRWKKGKPNLNGHMRHTMYDGSAPEIFRYRCGGAEEARAPGILRLM